MTIFYINKFDYYIGFKNKKIYRYSDLFEKKVTQKEYSEKDIEKRWDRKREHIKILSDNIHRLRSKLNRDLFSDDEKTKITACIIKIIDITGERVGNKQSSINGHYGISNLNKKHIKIDGDTVTLKYVGKSGVKHEKTFTNPTIASILKELKSRKTDDVFSTSDGISINSTHVNNYLKEFNITSKDIRGFKSNKMMIRELLKLGKVKDEKERKKIFNRLLRKVAKEIGHLPSTLRNHYLLPEIEENFYSYGSVGRIKI